MDKTYTIIPDFMLDYDLTITETIALAVIYGFSQDGRSNFHGSYSYLARKCKCSRQWAIEVVSSLIKKGYVSKKTKETNGVQTIYLRALVGGQENTLPVNSVDRGSQQSLPGGSQVSLPNNKDIDNKEKGRAFVPPTLDQVKDAFVSCNYSSDPMEFWAHYTNCGWKLSGGRGAMMKDWKLAAYNWEKREKQFNRNAR